MSSLAVPARRSGGRRGAGGFALVLCLWAVAIVLLLAAALDRYVAARVEQARAIRERLQAELDVYSTQNTVLYLLGTQRFTRAGLTTDRTERTGPSGAAVEGSLRVDPVGGELALDGSPYRGLGGARFSLQDETGLIALNSAEQDQLGALLAAFGAEGGTAARLLDTLGDYRDTDELARLNGAEAEQYETAGEAPPANRDLASAAEITRVLGWRDWLAGQPGFRVHDWLSAGRIATFNPNVAPVGLLAHVPGIDQATALEIVRLRQEQPFRSFPDFEARTDVTLAIAEDRYRFFPSDSLQLRVWRAGAEHATLLALQLTPLGREGPWQIKSIYRVARPRQDEVHEVPGFLFGAGTPPDL